MEHLDTQQNLLDRIVEDFVARYRRNLAPSVAEYARRYPKLAGQLQEMLPSIILLEQLKRKKSADAEATAAAPDKIGDYKILREVGRGGMGVVYEARQESLARPVALKVLPKHSLLDPKRLARFKIEAQAAARLHHSNIVPVFGLFESDGLFYYAMQLIDGEGLHEIVASLKESQGRSSQRHRPTQRGGRSTRKLSAKERSKQRRDRKTVQHYLGDQQTLAFSPGDPASETVEIFLQSSQNAAQSEPEGDFHRGHLPTTAGPIQLKGYWDQVAAIGLQVAEALQYAHDQGILHRDIKPANLLLDGSGTVWITDFGLAKVLEQGDLTGTGDVIGTLQYMAPESLQGKSDARSDVYSLGLTLYEMLTFQTPFAETNPVKLLQLVSQHEPVRPRRRNPAIPRDLETIVLKATHREPQGRYTSARALAADLKRFLEDRPIKARRAAVVEQVFRWCRRNRAVSALGAVALMSLLAAIVFAGMAYANKSRDLEVATSLRLEAETAKTEAEKAKKSETVRRLEAETAKTEAETAKREAEANMELSFGALRKTLEALAEHQPGQRNPADRAGAPGSPLGQGRGPNQGRGPHQVPGAPRVVRNQGPAPAGGAVAPVEADQFDAKLLATMLAFYDDLVKQKAPSPELKEEAAKAYTHLAEVYSRLGNTDDAAKNFRSAADVYAAIREARPREARFTVAAAEVAMKWSALPAEPGATPQPLALAEQADDWAAQLQRHMPGSPSSRELRARTQWTLGRVHMKMGQAAEAEPRYRDAIELQLQSVDERPGPPPKFENLLAMQSELAHLLVQSHKPDEAMSVVKASAAAIKKTMLPPEMNPVLVGHLHDFSSLLSELDDKTGAEALDREAAEFERRREPNNGPRRERPFGEEGPGGRHGRDPAGHGSPEHEPPPDRGPPGYGSGGADREGDRGPGGDWAGDRPGDRPGDHLPGDGARRPMRRDAPDHNHGPGHRPGDRSPRDPEDHRHADGPEERGSAPPGEPGPRTPEE